MPTIDFYLINEPVPETFACRLVDKIYQQKHLVYIHTASLEAAKKLDDSLWTFRDISFIPHCLHGESSTPMPLIQIGHAAHPEAPYDILINLTHDIPNFFNHYKRVIEIVPQEKDWKESARKKYRVYKDKGCELTTHDLTK